MTNWGNSGLSISITTQAGGARLVAVRGELDVLSFPQLEMQLAELARDGRVGVVLDVSELVFIDSSGLNGLVQSGRTLRAAGGRLLVAGASDHIARVFGLVRLEDSVELHASLPEALTSLASTPPDEDEIEP